MAQTSQSMSARSEELMRLLGRTSSGTSSSSSVINNSSSTSQEVGPIINSTKINSSSSEGALTRSPPSIISPPVNGASVSVPDEKKSGSVGSSSSEGEGSAGGLTNHSGSDLSRSSSVPLKESKTQQQHQQQQPQPPVGASTTAPNDENDSAVMTTTSPPSSGLSTKLATTITTATTTAATSTTLVKKKKKDKKKRVINISLCKYSVIAQLAEEFGFSIDSDEEVEQFNFTFIWADTVLPIQKLGKLQNWQRFNHFPSMHLLSRKVHLGVTLGRMRKVYSAHYAFYPRTWSLRSERSQFTKHVSTLPTKRKKGSTKGIFIMKPNCGSQGNGIIITRNPLEEVSDLENYIVQEYIAKPLLIEGKKFDLRVYVLVTSIRHFSAFIFNDGLVRMCAEDYVKPTDENMKNTCIHLTNYAVNKHSEQFVFNSDAEKGDVGNKRDFRFFNDWLVSQGHDPAQMWDRVEYMISKSFMAAQPQMSHVYNSCFGTHNNDGFTCFEVLGFDIMLDENLKPWLLEVNHTPSFNCDTPLDRRIKSTLLREVWKIVDVANIDKSKQVEKDRLNALKRMTSATAGGVSSDVTSEQHNDADVVALDAAQLRQKEISEMVSEVRAREDKSLENFRRIYPSPNNPQRQAVYEELNNAAKELTSVQTTACQEQRQNELKQERERRQKEKERMMSATGGGSGGNKPQPPAPPSLPGKSDSEPLSKRTTAPSGGSGSARAVGGSMGHGSVHRRSSNDINALIAGSSSSAAVTSPVHHHWHGTHPRTSPGSMEISSSSASGQPIRLGQDGSPLPHRPDHPSPRRKALSSEQEQQQLQQQDAERLRRKQQQERLNQQMERHRRRMVLGPRLSVFQLRESQMEAMLAAQQEQQGGGGGRGGDLGNGTPGGMLLDPASSLGVEIGGKGQQITQQQISQYQQDQQALAEYYSQLSVQNTTASTAHPARGGIVSSTAGGGNEGLKMHRRTSGGSDTAIPLANNSTPPRSGSFGRRGSNSFPSQGQHQQRNSVVHPSSQTERPQRRTGANNPIRTRSTSMKAGSHQQRSTGGAGHTTSANGAQSSNQQQQQQVNRIPMMMMHEEANPYTYYHYEEEE